MPAKAKTALTAAASLLSRREHSQQELRQKLQQRGFEEPDITAALERLTETNLQSDERFCHAFLKDGQRKFGDARLRYDLKQRGVPDAVAEAAMAQLPPEAERATAVLQRLLSATRKEEDAVAAVRRAHQTLMRRGFSYDSIRAATRALAADEPPDLPDEIAN